MNTRAGGIPGKVASTWALLLSVLLAGCQLVSTPGSSNAPDYWPTEGWRTSTPEEQGIDSDKLGELLLTSREMSVTIHSLLIIRHGYVVVDATFYPYDGEAPHNVASVTKSLMTTLIGIAIDQGKLSLDDRMVSFFSDRAIAHLDERKQAITVAHLASMSSGFECDGQGDEPTLREMVASPDYVQFVLDRQVAWQPGNHFEYCSPAIHMLSPILQQATGMPTLDFARQNLFEPLGFGEVLWPQDPQGYYNGWADASLDPHDMAKLGFLFLHGGEWDGRQIVSRSWVEEATSVKMRPPNKDPYGYGWWMERASPGAYHAAGRGGQNIYVFPEWDMIIVTTGGGFEMDEIAELVLASFVDFEKPLPPNPEGVARLEAAVDAVSQPPDPTPPAALPDVAKQVSGQTYLLEPNPSTLESFSLEFDGSSEAVFSFEASGLSLASPSVGLDGVFRFTTSPDGRPVAFRGAWIDKQTFLLEYDGITNNDHAFFRFRFEGDRVGVTVQETAHAEGATFVGQLQGP
ncbi:MAG TPA: serine hydrolase [Anaerolineales bacterium]|nr:serine hydrolase [Anaerolineales bacterium]